MHIYECTTHACLIYIDLTHTHTLCTFYAMNGKTMHVNTSLTNIKSLQLGRRLWKVTDIETTASLTSDQYAITHTSRVMSPCKGKRNRESMENQLHTYTKKQK